MPGGFEPQGGGVERAPADTGGRGALSTTGDGRGTPAGPGGVVRSPSDTGGRGTPATRGTGRGEFGAEGGVVRSPAGRVAGRAPAPSGIATSTSTRPLARGPGSPAAERAPESGEESGRVVRRGAVEDVREG